MEHSLLLLDQNTNAQIDEAVIQIQIAKLYAAAGETDRALTHYKKHNWAGINNGRIGTLLSSAGRYEEARPYLSASALEQITELIQVTIGMSACAAQTGSPSEAFEVLSWMRQVLDGLKIPGKVCYLDKQMYFCCICRHSFARMREICPPQRTVCKKQSGSPVVSIPRPSIP